MKTNKLVSCPQCGGFGFTSTPVSKNYGTTVCRAKTCELCHGAGVIEVPMTNADRIRDMRDEELNELFHEIYNAGAEDAVSYVWGNRTNNFEWTMEWLQQPVEE